MKKVLNKTSLKRFILITYLVILIILALPNFSFNVGGRQINYDGGNFLNIGINANFPSLRRGKDIFPSVRHTAQINFDENEEGEEISIDEKKDIAGRILSIIHTRLKYAKMEDVEVTAKQDAENNFFIELTIPDNYPDQREYVDWILSTGSVDFISVYTDPENPENFDFSAIDAFDYDFDRITISQSVVVPLDETQKQSFTFPHLYLTLRQTIGDTFGFVPELTYQDFVSGSASVRMNIGTQAYALYAEPESDPINGKVIRALPTGTEKQYEDADIMNLLELTQAYFQTDEIEQSFTILEETKVVGAQFNAEGGTLMAVSFALGSLMICIMIAKKQGLRKGLLFTFTFTSTLLASIIILKMLRYSISSGFLFGFIVAIPILALIINSKIQEPLESKEISKTGKVFLSFAPLFSYLTINIASGTDVFVYGFSGFLYLSVLIVVLMAVFISLAKSSPDKFNVAILFVTITMSLIVNTTLNIELAQSAFAVILMVLSGLAITFNFVYREAYRTFIK